MSNERVVCWYFQETKATHHKSLRAHHYSQNVFPAFINKCSTIGPRLSAGKKVNAPTITITLTNNVVNSGVVTGNVPSDGGTIFLRARLPAIASIGMTIMKRPMSVARPIVVLYQ